MFAEEPTPPNNPLLALENVVCTPHLAWLTQETLERIIDGSMPPYGIGATDFSLLTDWIALGYPEAPCL